MGSVARAAIGAAVAWTLHASAGHAAEAPAFELDWRAGPDCPSENAVREEIARLVASSPHAVEPVAAHAVVEAENGRHRVTIETRSGGRDGRRTIEAASCREVADATAVVVALAVDPALATTVGATWTDAGASEAAPPAPPARSEDPARAREPTTADRATGPRDAAAAREIAVHVQLAAGATLDAGTMPDAAFAPVASLAISRGALRVRATAAYWPARRAYLPGRTDAGGDLDLLAIGGAGCWALRQRAPEIAACAGAELDRMHGRGVGVDRPAAGSTSWLAIDAGAEARVPLVGPIAADLAAGAAIPVARPWFFLDGLGRVHRASALAARVAAGLSVQF